MEYFSTFRKITKVKKGEKLEKLKGIKNYIICVESGFDSAWNMEAN